MPKESNSEELQPLIKKVDSGGSGWNERRESKREDNEQDESIGFQSGQDIFGHKVLSVWEFKNKRGKLWGMIKRMPISLQSDQIERINKSFETKVNDVHEQLRRLLGSDRDSVVNFIVEYLKTLTDLSDFTDRIDAAEEDYQMSDKILDDIIRERKLKLTDQERGALKRRAELASIILDRYKIGRNLPTEVLISMLEHHQGQILVKEKEMSLEIKEFTQKVKILLLEAITQNKLPVSREMIEERLGVLQFKVVDQMSARLDEKWGDYNDESHRIRLSTEIPKDKRWKVFTHEVFHAISGQIENMKTVEEMEGDPLVTMYGIIKLGTRFYDFIKDFESGKGLDPQLRWLNEAITEEATGDLINEKWSYKNERELLGLLIQAGISKDLFLSSYFENYNNQAPEGEHRLPKTRDLFVAVNQKFGPGFLMNLDRFIIKSTKPEDRSSGVKKAVRLWKESPDTFPGFVNLLSYNEADKNRERFEKKTSKKPKRGK